MKNKWISIAVLTVAVLLFGILAFRWEARYAGWNPVIIEKAKAAIDQGRGYEVLEENQVYLTDDAQFSDLLNYLERQYGLQLSTFEDETVIFTGDHGHMTFGLTEIVSFGKTILYLGERELTEPNLIYLDNAATTKPIESLETLMAEYRVGRWYNPSALYKGSADAEADMAAVRKTLLGAVGGYDRQVIFTASGTESNNMAVFDAVKPREVSHFVFSAYEHAAIFACAKMLMDSGHEVTFVSPDERGVIQAKAVVGALKGNTVLVGVMHVNNETGALNDIDDIAASAKAAKKDVRFHSDGVQAFLKAPYSLSEAVDSYSVSAHKVGALKGTGALFIKNSAKIKPLVLGGAQEKGMRAGTENTFGIAAFGGAVESFPAEDAPIFALHDRLIEGLSGLENIVVNSPTEDGLFSPYIVNISVLGVRSETLLHALEAKGIYIGIGSACSSKSRTNRIHDALKLSPERGESAVRISFSHENTIADVDTLLEVLDTEARFLRMFTRR